MSVAAGPAKRRAGAGDLRLVLMSLLLVGGFLGLGYRLFQIQVVGAHEFAARGLDQRLTTRELAAARGTIFDRDSNPLAVSVEATSIFATPQDVSDPLWTAQQLASVLGVPYRDLADRLESDSGFVYISRQVQYDVAEEVRALELPGIHFHAEATRSYPAGMLGGNILGFVNIDGLGIEGLEYRYEEQLRGDPGSLSVERDPSGRVIPQGRSEITPAIPGADLVTTLDSSVMHTADMVCRKAVEETSASRCAAVVIMAETGEVLAATTYPHFDPEARVSVDGSGFSSDVFRSVFEPGSTQKMITVAAAIEEGVVAPTTLIREVPDEFEVLEGACQSASDDLYGCFRDFSTHPPVDMTVRDIITASSNIGTIIISQLLSEGTLIGYMQKFGQSSSTGVDFSGEASGRINVPAGCGSCLASAAIGYSVSASPLQMAVAYAAIANDGVIAQPHIVKEIVSPDGDRTVVEIPTERVVTARTAWIMRELLANVVEYGTGGTAAIEGYRVAGKTGTANKVSASGGYSSLTVGSFVGMAPVDDPKVVVAVIVDEPAFEYRTGAWAAAPYFAEIMEHTLHHLRIPGDG